MVWHRSQRYTSLPGAATSALNPYQRLMWPWQNLPLAFSSLQARMRGKRRFTLVPSAIVFTVSLSGAGSFGLGKLIVRLTYVNLGFPLTAWWFGWLCLLV